MGTGNDNTPKNGDHGESEQDSEARSTLAKLTTPGNTKQIGLISKLRNYLLTGLIVVGPIALTLYGSWWLINAIDSWVASYIPERYQPGAWIQSFFKNTFDVALPDFSIPGFGLVFAVIFLIFIGALTANLFGRTLISYGELILSRMPIVRNIYSALKQIFETVLTSSGGSFQKVGLIEYPRPGLYAVCFISKETAGEIGEHKHEAGDELLSVFLPTTPNPTSGFLLFVPKKDIRILDMTVEEGAKLVISAGLVEPGVKLSGNLGDMSPEGGSRGFGDKHISVHHDISQESKAAE